MNISTAVMNNRNAYWQNYKEFERVFEVPLSKYMHIVLGFDILKFESELLGISDNMHLACAGKFGADSLSIVEKILALEISGNGTERVPETENPWREPK